MPWLNSLGVRFLYSRHGELAGKILILNQALKLRLNRLPDLFGNVNTVEPFKFLNAGG